MGKLYFCVECRRVLKEDGACGYCNSSETQELKVGSPVNVIGTKEKGKVIKVKDNKARLLIRTESNDKVIREYDYNKLKKVL